VKGGMKPGLSSDHESGIPNFIDPRRRERVGELLSRPKSRQAFVAELHHFPAWDARATIFVPPSEASAQAIAELLRARGAGDQCYLLSAERRFDKMELSLLDALRQVVGSNSGTIVSCVPGRLAYYEGEDRNTRIILERR